MWNNHICRTLEDLVDEEYNKWEKNYKEVATNVDKLAVFEIYGDLFDQPKEYSLAHCVAEDLKMGKGIAATFRREFQNLDILREQKVKKGGVGVLEDKRNKRFIYYLITKRESAGKPTYRSLFESLYNMREHIRRKEVKKLALPRLGCGLDRLEWSRVKSIIIFLFKRMELEIVICKFTSSAPKSCCCCCCCRTRNTRKNNIDEI